jgi:L-serine/L-threonine ammonia-lyase
MIHLHSCTPLIESSPLSSHTGKQILLKLENTQPTGSFKIRGIGRLCQTAKQEGKTHFITSSGGNAGFAAAYAGRKLGIKTTVFVPSTTPPDTVSKIEKLNAEVLVKGYVWDETDEFATRLAEKTDALYISPFDHPLIWKGHATLVDEIANLVPKPDAIVLSVGGGGLLCGVIQGLHANNWQDVPVVAVETEGADSFAASQKAQKLVTLDNITSIAETLGAKTVSQQTLEWDKKHPIKSVVVSDEQALSACIRFADDHRFLVEPACGASLTVAYEAHEVLKKAESVVVIVCGGIGADMEKLKRWQSLW